MGRSTQFLSFTRSKHLLVLFVIAFFSGQVFAEAVVLRSKGKVWFEDADGLRTIAKVGEVNTSAVKLHTSKRSQAVVDVNGDILVMSANSSIEIKSSSWLEQISGFIYYSFRKAAADEPDRKITTQTATIGIRGTRLTVSSGDSDEATIALEEGKIEVAPQEGEFALKRLPPPESVEDYKKQAQDHMKNAQSEFEKYKQKQQKAFVEYVESVYMEPGQVLRIDGSNAEEGELDKKLQKQMARMRDFADDVFSQDKYQGL